MLKEISVLDFIRLMAKNRVYILRYSHTTVKHTITKGIRIPSETQRIECSL